MEHSVMSGLSPDQVDQFNRDGYLCPIDVLDGAETQSVLNVVRDGGKRLSALTRAKPHLLFPELWDLVHDPRVLDKIESLLGPDIFCMGSSTIEKAAGSDNYVAWHQDATFWGMDNSKGATAWIALTPSRDSSGCVRVVPGTHGSQMQHRDTQDDLNMLGAREELCDLPTDDSAVSLTLEPGQMSLHHPLIVHGSEPNREDFDRIGFVARYFSADATQDGGSVTLVRGRNLSGMTLERGPGEVDRSETLKQHADVLRRFGKVIRREKESHLKQEGSSS